MPSFKQTMKDKLLSPYSKTSLSSDKVADVIAEEDGKCVLVYKNMDGILVKKENVPVKKSLKGIFNGKVKKGDKVEIQETGNIIRVIRVLDKNDYNDKDEKTSDISSGTSDFGGFLGV